MSKYLIPALVLLIPSYIIRFDLAGIPTTLIEILIYLVFLFYLLTQWNKINSFVKSKVFLFASLFVISGLVGAIIDPNLRDGFGLFKGYFIDGVLLYILIGATGEKESIKNALIASGTLVALSALVVSRTTPEGRLLDLDALSPNYLAMFLTPIFVLGAFQLQNYFAHNKHKYLLAISLAIMLWAIVLTGSRGALIGIMFALIYSIYAFYKDKLSKRSLTKLSIALSAIALVAVVATALVFAPDWSDHSRKATSSNVRFYIWSTTIEIIKQNPILGVGLSNYQNYFSDLTKDMVNYPEFISPQALSAHNIYLNLYATSGLLGLFAFAAFVIGSKFWRKDQAAGVALVSVLAYGLVDTPFFRNDLALLFFVIMILLYSDQESAHPEGTGRGK